MSTPPNPPDHPSRSETELTRLPIRAVQETLDDTVALLHSTGPLKMGHGRVSGIVALVLGALSLLAVLAFHFPEYLTTPELRQQYSVDVLRQILLACMVLAGTTSMMNIILARKRTINGVAWLLVATAALLGGPYVPVDDFPDHTPYIGMDWFVLDLLGSTLIFVAIEKALPLRRGQLIFRNEWQTDFIHFTVNHFIVGLILLTVNFLVHRLFGWMINETVQSTIQSIAYIPQLLLCILVADFVQYWTHRAYHEIPLLWRFHAVHHSAKTMDWLAGSRQHMLELITTRVCVLGLLYVFGFSKEVMDGYIIVVGFQAVFNHANVHVPLGPLRYLIVSPAFHHWHHASDDAAIDRNYAAHYAFLDYIFGTAVRGQARYPERYGVVGDYMPEGFVNQQLFPFRSSKSS